MPVTTDPYYAPASGTNSRGTYVPPTGAVVAPPGTSGVIVRDEKGQIIGVKYVDATGKIVRTFQYDPANVGGLIPASNEGDAPPTQKFDAGFFVQEYGVYLVAGLVLLFKIKR